MSHRKIKMAFPESFPDEAKPRKLSEVKDKDSKRFMIEDAARTIKRSTEIEREIAQMKADPKLFKAAQALIDQELSDLKKAATI